MKVGSIVECVDDIWTADRDIRLIPNRPVRGKFYTVREIEPSSKGVPGIRLEEIVNPLMMINSGFIEPTFRIERFREVEGLDEAIEELLEEALYETI
jgi:hypothetical protein